MRDQRYSIEGWKIIDAERDPVAEIYIRELLDMASAEYQRSRLSERDRMNVIDALGLDVLVPVLDDCFRKNRKPYDAAQEAELTLLVLNKLLERQAPPPPLTEVDDETRPIVTFMQQYFDEQRALFLASEERSAPYRERYFTREYNDRFNAEMEADRAYARQHPAAVIEARPTKDKATVITSEPLGDGTEKCIYHLCQVGEGWRIARKGRECQACEGTGQAFGTPCSLCEGGWAYYGD